MADLQKTIKGLRCHSEPKFGPDEYFCETCPYDEATCGLDVPNDALSLLKAQEPRVMTLEEIPEYDGAFLIEYRHEVWPMQWALFRLKLTIAYRFIRGDSELGFSISKDSYGETWRCWTSRPNDEQRKVTPWKN